jgi:hypothetical protein
MYFDGERAGGSDSIEIIDMEQGDGPCFQMEDWAIFILADRLGDSFGYLGATTIDCDAQKNKPIFVRAPKHSFPMANCLVKVHF